MDDKLQLDLQARQQALDVAQSFIVQAPAGSGKTELLTQRVLALLAHVQRPEEVLAITFTRKAAGEMRERIVRSLERAQGPTPESEHERRTYELAKAVLKRDETQAWHLLDNPSRLQVMTIDAFCSMIARRMPVLARFGMAPNVVEDAWPWYEQAARETLQEIESSEEIHIELQYLVEYLDNNLGQIEQLLASMLSRRDHWLKYIAGTQVTEETRSHLEENLRCSVEEHLEDLAYVIDSGTLSEIHVLLDYVSANLGVTVDEQNRVVYWRAIADMFLTQKGEWRRSVTKRQGFPSVDKKAPKEEQARQKYFKEKWQEVVSGLNGHENLRAFLEEAALLPDPRYSDKQWRVLQSLIQILPRAVAHLNLIFQSHRHVDFSEVSQAAFLALGDIEDPSEIALSLDYRINHILVDEFQDTSLLQFQLLEKLTAGWQPDEGRTLFLVGDPMQSIYRFREAEVGLYLRAVREGIGSVKLQYQRLYQNFRSDKPVIEWVNRCFSQVFPAQDDLARGAVSYSPSMTVKTGEQLHSVDVLPLWSSNPKEEAAQVINLVQQYLKNDCESRIAVLVKARTHLPEIVKMLRKANIGFQATEIEPLDKTPFIQDLFSLLSALAHPADKLAWIALLRAPWCGLTLNDLFHIAEYDGVALSALSDDALLSRLSEEGQIRVKRFYKVMNHVHQQRGRGSETLRLKTAWLGLGGDACLERENQRKDVETFFELVADMEAHQGSIDVEAMRAKLAKLYAQPNVVQQHRVEVMTIHKSKGLEFDHVILPGLGRSGQSDNAQLMLWLEKTRRNGMPHLLLAPIKESSEQNNEIYSYLSRVNKEKDAYESQRLLYVAATRAKRSLNLVGYVPYKEDEHGEIKPGSPRGGSLLASAWNALSNDYIEYFDNAQRPAGTYGDDASPFEIGQDLPRFSKQWLHPYQANIDDLPEGPLDTADNAADDQPLLHETTLEQKLGVVIHRALEWLGNGLISTEDQCLIEGKRPLFVDELRQQGVPETNIDAAVNKVVFALQQTLADKRGRWILDANHQCIQNELTLTVSENGQWQSFIVDRTFVDRQNRRWIIDYKTSTSQAENLDAFLKQEQAQYAPQLQNYGTLFKKLEPQRVIMLGLYFPMHQGWCEWAFSSP